MIQWVKLSEEGVTLIKASPEITAPIAVGNYELKLKIIGQPASSQPLVVTGNLDLRCVSTEEGAQCQSEDGHLIEFPAGQ